MDALGDFLQIVWSLFYVGPRPRGQVRRFQPAIHNTEIVFIFLRVAPQVGLCIEDALQVGSSKILEFGWTIDQNQGGWFCREDNARWIVVHGHANDVDASLV